MSLQEPLAVSSETVRRFTIGRLRTVTQSIFKLSKQEREKIYREHNRGDRRRNRQWLQLKGLIGQSYRTAYMQLRRAEGDWARKDKKHGWRRKVDK